MYWLDALALQVTQSFFLVFLFLGSNHRCDLGVFLQCEGLFKWCNVYFRVVEEIPAPVAASLCFCCSISSSAISVYWVNALALQ